MQHRACLYLFTVSNQPSRPRLCTCPRANTLALRFTCCLFLEHLPHKSAGLMVSCHNHNSEKEKNVYIVPHIWNRWRRLTVILLELIKETDKIYRSQGRGKQDKRCRAARWVKTSLQIVCACPPLTFESKLVELSGQVVDHHSLAAGLPQPVHPVDEVGDHLVDGVGVRQDVFGLQHPRVQDAAYALPLRTHSARINEMECFSFLQLFLHVYTRVFY